MHSGKIAEYSFREDGDLYLNEGSGLKAALQAVLLPYIFRLFVTLKSWTFSPLFDAWLLEETLFLSRLAVNL